MEGARWRWSGRLSASISPPIAILRWPRILPRWSKTWRGRARTSLHAVAAARSATSSVRPGSDNVQGEAQQKLDILANDIFLRANEKQGHLAGMVSEEMEVPFAIPAPYPKGRYLLVFDPLDGSSNIDVNVRSGASFQYCGLRRQKSTPIGRLSTAGKSTSLCRLCDLWPIDHAGHYLRGPAFTASRLNLDSASSYLPIQK